MNVMPLSWARADGSEERPHFTTGHRNQCGLAVCWFPSIHAPLLGMEPQSSVRPVAPWENPFPLPGDACCGRGESSSSLRGHDKAASERGRVRPSLSLSPLAGCGAGRHPEPWRKGQQ